MTEQVPSEAPETAHDEQVPSAPDGLEPTTGVPGVDRILADLDQLEDLPLEDHLGAFERAHGALRAALDSEPGPPA